MYMQELNDVTGPASISDGNYMLMFYTDWCPLCPPVISILSELEKSEAGKFVFAKIDFDKNPQSKEFFNIPGVPAVLAIKNRKVLHGWAGLKDAEFYRGVINRVLNEPDENRMNYELNNLQSCN